MTNKLLGTLTLILAACLTHSDALAQALAEAAPSAQNTCMSQFQECRSAASNQPKCLATAEEQSCSGSNCLSISKTQTVQVRKQACLQSADSKKPTAENCLLYLLQCLADQ